MRLFQRRNKSNSGSEGETDKIRQKGKKSGLGKDSSVRTPIKGKRNFQFNQNNDNVDMRTLMDARSVYTDGNSTNYTEDVHKRFGPMDKYRTEERIAGRQRIDDTQSPISTSTAHTSAITDIDDSPAFTPSSKGTPTVFTPSPDALVNKRNARRGGRDTGPIDLDDDRYYNFSDQENVLPCENSRHVKRFLTEQSMAQHDDRNERDQMQKGRPLYQGDDAKNSLDPFHLETSVDQFNEPDNAWGCQFDEEQHDRVKSSQPKDKVEINKADNIKRLRVLGRIHYAQAQILKKGDPMKGQRREKTNKDGMNSSVMISGREFYDQFNDDATEPNEYESTKLKRPNPKDGNSIVSSSEDSGLDSHHSSTVGGGSAQTSSAASGTNSVTKRALPADLRIVRGALGRPFGREYVPMDAKVSFIMLHLLPRR